MDAEGLMPVAGVDYPATFAQLTRWFPDGEACTSYLARLRWPEGRTSHSRGLLFYRLLQQAVATDPHPYRELTTAASLDHYL